MNAAIRGLLICCAVLTVFAERANGASLPATESNQFMVVSAQRLAAEAGAQILRAGGNAIDAAVAIGYAEAVTNPCCGNLGGGGFLLAHLADAREVFINFRETAPAAASPTMYLSADGNVIPGASLHGWPSAGVPGTVLGLDTALTQYGSLPRSVVMAPAIRLARDGFILEQGDTDILARSAALLRQQDQVARVFLQTGGSPFRPGDRLVQKELADTLEEVAAEGPGAFYKGRAARAIDHDSEGALTAADLAAYHVTEPAPITCSYRDIVVLSAPPPSSGGVALCEILEVLNGFDMRGMGFHSAQSVHVMTEAMRHAFVDRNGLLGDPEFVSNPVASMLSREHVDAIRSAITDRATPSSMGLAGVPPHERPQTTSYSVLDHAGNAVAVTYTLNGAFGSGLMPNSTGFLMNNEMDDFTIKPGVANHYGLVQGEANAIAPGKRPLSSMAPTIVLRDGKVAMVLGSPGGSRIITIVLEAILNMVDYGMTPQEAIDAPRFHHQWLPDTIFAEHHALSPDTVNALRAMGYTITEQNNWGAAALIAVAPLLDTKATGDRFVTDTAASGAMRPGMIYGAMDARRPAGAAIGQ